MKNYQTPVEGQAQEDITAAAFREQLRSMAREALLSLVEKEVVELCGAKHQPNQDRLYFRAGGVSSPVYLNGRQEKLRKPRVRKRRADGSSSEHLLKTWQLAKDPEEWEAAMMRAVICGVSTRKVATLRESEVAGESKSSLSRLWQRKARDLADEMLQADLSGFDLVVLMLDGIVLSKGLVVTVAMGIDSDGRKRILGFRCGGSENQEVASDLLNSLSQRGLRLPENRQLLAVLDGSKALENAVLCHFPGALIQRCLIHKERNIRSYLSKRHWGELERLFRALRESQGSEHANEAAKALRTFLEGKNAQAMASFLEGGETLTTVMKLKVPNTLHPSLLSTNAIENSFKNLRRHIGRVCRWREDGKQVDLWVSSGLKLAEQGFRRVRGYHDFPLLIKALERAKTTNRPATSTAP